jgi:phage major head subunit gpT-like protein
LRELARECLRMAGQPINGDVMQMVGRALTTSDFPILLGNTANLSLMAGWEMAEESWEKWADGSGSVSDFKTNTMARAGETDDLDEIGEDDEYKYGTHGEQSEQFRVVTYGKLNKISRQAIINDELGSITDSFARRGEAAARKVGDIVYAVLTANSAMGDGVALFHADHGNLGTTGAVSETTVAEIIKLMGLQKDINGKRRLNINPRYLIAPKALEGTAEVFFNSQMFAAASTAATRGNPYAGTRFERVYEARLDDDSATAWYMATAKGKTVKVFFLNGNRTPYLETRDGWTVDGVEFKTRIYAGAKAVDWRGMAKNAGA